MSIDISTSSHEKNSLPSYHLDFLEGVKFLAILWIAWYHIDQMIMPENSEVVSIRSLASLGFSGVNVFLLLSGLGLTFSMSRTQLKSSLSWHKLPWKSFFIRRLLRIYPLYFFAHFLFLVFGIIQGKYADMPLDVGFLLSITGLRVFFPKYFWYGPDAFWFVGLIIQFYVLFPFLFLLLTKTKNTKFLFLIFIACIFSRLITINSENSYIFMLGLAPNRLAEFCVGMVVGFDLAVNRRLFRFFSLPLSNYRFWVVSIPTMVLAGFLYWDSNSLLRIIFIDVILSLTSSLFLLILVNFSKLNNLFYRFLISSGFISYSFYLLHSPPIRPAFSVFNSIGIHNIFVASILYLLIIGISSLCISRLEVFCVEKLIKIS